MAQQHWILATGNMGKKKEFDELFRQVGVNFSSLKDIGFEGDIEETGTSFEENAFIKAKAIAKDSNLPVLADDSGLEVEALNGAPGIYSARFAGPGASDLENRNLLLDKLKGQNNRNARFVCVLALVYPDGREKKYEGFCPGQVALEEKGSLGFGYDSLFIPEGYNRTFGELGMEIKEKTSHRTRAVEALLKGEF